MLTSLLTRPGLHLLLRNLHLWSGGGLLLLLLCFHSLQSEEDLLQGLC